VGGGGGGGETRRIKARESDNKASSFWGLVSSTRAARDAWEVGHMF
jgi:hypothetical protein